MSRQIEVNEERFARAISRAVAHDFEDHIDYRWTYVEPGQPSESFFEVGSMSRPDSFHGVRVYRDDNDDYSVTCTCECGFHGQHACWHMAGALILMGVLNAPDPDVPTEEEIEAEQARIMAEIYAELDQIRAHEVWEMSLREYNEIPF